MKLRDLIAATSLFALTAGAQSALVGDTVTASQTSPYSGVSLSASSATVTAGGPELVYNLGQGRTIQIDIQDTYIDFTFFGAQSFSNAYLGIQCCSVTIGSIDTLITALTLTEFDVVETVIGVPAMAGNTASFTGNSVTMVFDGDWTVGDRVRLDLTFDRNPNPVSEPGALALAGLALGGLAWSRRRRA